jgi:hypothetical protein
LLTYYFFILKKNKLIDFPRCAFPPLLITLMKPLSRMLAVVVGGGGGVAQRQDLVAAPVMPQTDYKHDISEIYD